VPLIWRDDHAAVPRLDELDRDAQVAVSVVREAMQVARSLECRTHALSKPDTTPVTVADFAIQAIVAERLGNACPGDALIAEEDASPLDADPDRSWQILEAVGRIIPDATMTQITAWLGGAGSRGGSRWWTLDPIDGTRGFLNGRQYVTALALAVDGRVEMSVIGCPHLSVGPVNDAAGVATPSAHGGIAIAVRGHGAWWRPDGDDTLQRLAVSTRRDPADARVVQSFEVQHGDPGRSARVRLALGVLAPPLLLDSQAKHVAVAAGSSDLLIRFPPHPGFHDAVWDQAPGSLLIEEAGGRITDLAGTPLDFTTGRRLLSNTGMLASNGLLHTAALEAIRHVS
jgi:3'(2'), 5'-bisphosphate nucleotidase